MSDEPPEPDDRFTVAQWLLLLLLAAVQLTHIVDFLLLVPLATYLQDDLGVRTRAFGMLVSSYGFAAALTGLLLAPWLDRFDRKLTLLTLYAGFGLGTLLCTVAPSYGVLLVGRIVAGACGGVANAVVLAIVGDAFPVARRGTATGVVMSAFSVASIVGVPAGLLLAEQSSFGWRAPFAVLALTSLLIWLVGIVAMPSVAGHLNDRRVRGGVWEVLTLPRHLRAYTLMVVLVFSSFPLFPYLAAFLVNNVGRTKEELKYVYLVGGAATLFTMNLAGRLSDRFPRLLVFRVAATATLVPVLAITCLPAGTPLWLTLTVTTLLMVLSSSRMVPAMAMITSSAEPRLRGSFLSVNGAVQQLACGLAPLLSGLLMSDNGPGTPLLGYPLVGVSAGFCGLLSLILAGRLRPAPEAGSTLPADPEPARSPRAKGERAGVPGVGDVVAIEDRLTP